MINREMENLKIDFDILEGGAKITVSHRKASNHLVFHIRIKLEYKTLWVNDGHKTPEPEQYDFARVVSRECIRIALTHATLNYLPICACDIQNECLQAPYSDKHYVVCSLDFIAENVGKFAKIIRALYGGKSAEADYCVHVHSAMEDM